MAFMWIGAPSEYSLFNTTNRTCINKVPGKSSGDNYALSNDVLYFTGAGYIDVITYGG